MLVLAGHNKVPPFPPPGHHIAVNRQEDASFQASDVALRRQEAQRKAEERERQQSEALRRRWVQRKGQWCVWREGQRVGLPKAA